MRDERILFTQLQHKDFKKLRGIMKFWSSNTHKLTFANRHVLERIRQRDIKAKDVILTIKYGTYIEFHVVGNSPRVLIRKQREGTTDDICVVLEIKKGAVLTAYINKTSDTHETLREEEYNPELNVLQILGECGMM